MHQINLPTNEFWVEYKGFTIIEDGQSWRIFKGKQVLYTVKTLDEGRQFVDKALEAAALQGDGHGLGFAVIVAEQLTGGYWFGVQYHHTDRVPMFEWQAVTIHSAMYPDFSRWAIVYRP